MAITQDEIDLIAIAVWDKFQSEGYFGEDIANNVWAHSDGSKVAEALLGSAEISTDETHVTVRKRANNDISHEFTISSSKLIRTAVVPNYPTTNLYPADDLFPEA